MEFIIRRSSLWSEDKPLENAYKSKLNIETLELYPRLNIMTQNLMKRLPIRGQIIK